MTSDRAALPGYTGLPEPDLLFHGRRTEKHPLRGLIKHGPYGLTLGSPTTVRLALLAPSADISRMTGLVDELNATARPREATNYYPEYPGFHALFRVPIAPQDSRLIRSFPDALDRHASAEDKVALAQGLFQSIAQLDALRTEFDVALVYLPSAMGSLLRGRELRLPRLPEGPLRAIEHPHPDCSPCKLRSEVPGQRHVGAQRRNLR